MIEMSRRRSMVLGTGCVVAGILTGRRPVEAAAGELLTIAFNVNLPAFDPTAGSSAVNPALQAIYRSIFDQFIGQKPDLAFEPGLLTAWGWNDDKTQVWMDVREGVTWHDGSPLTPEDVAWSLQRAGDPKGRNPSRFVWAKIGDFKVEGRRVTGKVLSFDPTLFMRMAFLTGYVLPKAYIEKVGAAGFEKKPIGTGPYMVDGFEGGSFLRLKANPRYWGPKPAFDSVVFKFVTDATGRVAEIESGSSDLTLEIPFEDYDRLRARKDLSGIATPISDIGMIFITNVAPMLDKNVRLAAIHAIDKETIIKRLLRGYGVSISTLETPEYSAYDPAIRVDFDPKRALALLATSGYSPQNPVRFTIQTTRGFKPKDYEMVEAIVGMWRKVGIEATIEVYEIAKHFELRAAHKLAPAAFYNWGDAIGDPTSSTGSAMFGSSVHSAWKTAELDARIEPLWSEKDNDKRIAGWKAVDRYIAEEGLVIPLLQYVQPILFKKTLHPTPNMSGALQPTLVSRA